MLVWCGASCVQPQLNRADDVTVMRQRRSRPLQERWRVGFACTRTVETTPKFMYVLEPESSSYSPRTPSVLNAYD